MASFHRAYGMIFRVLALVALAFGGFSEPRADFADSADLAATQRPASPPTFPRL